MTKNEAIEKLAVIVRKRIELVRATDDLLRAPEGAPSDPDFGHLVSGLRLLGEHEKNRDDALRLLNDTEWQCAIAGDA